MSLKIKVMFYSGMQTLDLIEMDLPFPRMRKAFAISILIIIY